MSEAHAERIRELVESLRNTQEGLAAWAKRDIESEQRIASLEAQLATAREGTREAAGHRDALIAAVRPVLELASLSVPKMRICDTPDNAFESMCALRKLLASPPPRVDGWIPAFPVERLASGRYVVLLECGDCDVGELNDLGWRALHGYELKGQYTRILCCGPLPDLPDAMPPSQPDAGTESK